MVALADEYGADVQLVALMQYLRVVIVVLSASIVSRLLLGAAPVEPEPPFFGSLFEAAPVPVAATLIVAVVGAWIGRLLKLSGGALLVPMMLAIAVQSSGVLAITLLSALLGVTYMALGWYVGLGFTRQAFVHAFRALPQLIFSMLLLIVLCGFSAWLLTALVHTDPLTAYLATSPGGLDSVVIIAIGSHANVSLVMAIQTLRLFAVIVTGPQIAKLVCRYA